MPNTQQYRDTCFLAATVHTHLHVNVLLLHCLGLILVLMGYWGLLLGVIVPILDHGLPLLFCFRRRLRQLL
jgi:hypothetical protein